MAEDEAERLVQGEQPLLLFHDQVVDVVVRLRVASGVLEDALLVRGEVAVVQPIHGLLEPLQLLEPLLAGKGCQFRLERFGELALDRLTGSVVVAIVGYTVHEEEAEHLDAAPADPAARSPGGA